MEFKKLVFTTVHGALSDYEEARLGCFSVQIWCTKNAEEEVSAYHITLCSGIKELDSAHVLISSFHDSNEEKRIEKAHDYAKYTAQELFENYLKTNFMI